MLISSKINSFFIDPEDRICKWDCDIDLHQWRSLFNCFNDKQKKNPWYGYVNKRSNTVAKRNLSCLFIWSMWFEFNMLFYIVNSYVPPTQFLIFFQLKITFKFFKGLYPKTFFLSFNRYFIIQRILHKTKKGHFVFCI